MRLSPRLIEVAKLVPKSDKILDVGTDHGYIPVYLVENNITKKAIAADINEGPLNSAREYVNKEGHNDNIDIRLGNGLDVVKKDEKIDAAIIAGMGGILIANILKDNKDITKNIDSFILQPMVASEDLRKFLYNNGYNIIDEKLAREEDRYYEIIVAKHSEKKIELDEIYYEIGLKLIENKDPLLENFVLKKINNIKKIMRNIEENGSMNNKKYLQLKRKFDKLKEVYDNEIKGNH